MQEYDGFIEAGLALSATHAVDAVEGEPAMTKDLGEDFIAGKRMSVELAIADHVRQATAPGADLGDLSACCTISLKYLVIYDAIKLPSRAMFLV